ncbi:MAG: M28 family peptidase [Elusimicrobia bacterium]|nr:M28 family peptidase [Elusimicrobiota bacterium]
MKNIFFPLVIILAFAAGLNAGTVNHALEINIDPQNHSFSVKDTLTLADAGREFIFSLHQGLNPSVKAKDAALELIARETAQKKYGINYSSNSLFFDAYRVTLAKPSKTFTLEYGGIIDHPLGERAEEYARSFSETPGVISGEGCYLSGSSGWYPHFESSLVAFRLETRLPAPFDCVAGGARVKHSADKTTIRTIWEEKNPQDEITLVCGKYSEYKRRGGPSRFFVPENEASNPANTSHSLPVESTGRVPLEYYAFLRSPDRELAENYLDAAEKYAVFYSGLIGPYPYSKFALVENFWETGYGLPSFTLLGPKVIRLPFIINSSYPHEILHNWWGNGVFVDYEKGNWCEGLTAYMADYLIAENRGKGKEYRETTLQKYADYVLEGKDFPLTEFRSRDSSVSEAVGYGKALMLYHMLRNVLGDARFKTGLRDFYADNRFRLAGFDDLKKAFEKRTGSGRLDRFFTQWTERAGAPELALKNIRTGRGMDGEYTLEFTLAQVQEGPAYALEVPAFIYLENMPQPRPKLLTMTAKEETFQYSAPLKILRLEIDPEFDIFRKLDPLETPPALSRMLGAKKPALILPAGAGYAAWNEFASAWTKDKENLPVISSDSAAAAPPPGAYWLLGSENRFTPDFERGLEIYGARFSSSSIIMENQKFPRAGNTFVFAGFSGGLIISASTASLSALAAKLPHYGKYSWLVFDRDMNSAATGIWKTFSSPLGINLPGAEAPAGRRYPARAPLAVLPSVFSGQRIYSDVKTLASLPGGRGPGSPGLGKAETLVKAAFKEAGLAPFYPPGFSVPFTADNAGRELRLNNVIGKVEGTTAKDDYVVLSAHYDHLAAKGAEVFPGADDNASGVALLLELARYYAVHPARRTIIFAAFSGEEEGRLGSRNFVAGLSPATAAKINADLNFDTVGRLEGGKVLLLSSGSSDKWVHIFRGAGFVTGCDYDLVKEDLDSSDQISFIEGGVPAVQFFSGPKTDYHKFTDTAYKIDVAGVVKQAEFAKEIIDYLASDSDFITRPSFSGSPAVQPSSRPASPGIRKVYTGLVPDFTFQGSGVRAQDITPGSPLSKTAVKPLDVIIKINGLAVDGLKAYSDALKKFSPGDTIQMTYLSDNEQKTIEMEIAGR